MEIAVGGARGMCGRPDKKLAHTTVRSSPRSVQPPLMYFAIALSTLSFNLASDPAMTRRQAVGSIASALTIGTPAAAFARNNFAVSERSSAAPASSYAQPNQPKDSSSTATQQSPSAKSSPPSGGKPAATTTTSSQDDDLRRLGLKPMSDVDQCFTSTGRPYNCRP